MAEEKSAFWTFFANVRIATYKILKKRNFAVELVVCLENVYFWYNLAI